MALPWTAPGFGQGIFPSRAPFFIPETVDPKLVALIAGQREQNQKEIASSIQGVLSGLGSMIDQRRQDAIASQLLAGSAPQATAVGGAAAPAAQPAAPTVDPAYAERGLDLSPTGQPIAPATPPASLATFRPVVGAGMPSTALTAAEAAQNRALGYPTQQLMRPSEIYSARDKLYTQSLGDMYKQAQTARLLALTQGELGTKAPSGKIWSTSLGGWATPTQDAAERRRQAAEAGGTESAGAKQFYKDLEAKHGGLNQTILNKLDTTTPYDPANPATIQYVNEKGEQVATPTTAIEMQKTFAKSPSFAGRIPLSEFNAIIAQHKNIQSGAQARPAAGGQNQGGYVAGQRYGGRLYHGGDPFDENNWD